MVIFQAENKNTKDSLLVIILEEDNVKRMEKADPITLQSALHGGVLIPIEHPGSLQVVVALETDSGRVYEFLNRQDKGTRRGCCSI
jgi:hypothetical protein